MLLVSALVHVLVDVVVVCTMIVAFWLFWCGVGTGFVGYDTVVSVVSAVGSYADDVADVGCAGVYACVVSDTCVGVYADDVDTHYWIVVGCSGYADVNAVVGVVISDITVGDVGVDAVVCCVVV